MSTLRSMRGAPTTRPSSPPADSAGPSSAARPPPASPLRHTQARQPRADKSDAAGDVLGRARAGAGCAQCHRNNQRTIGRPAALPSSRARRGLHRRRSQPGSSYTCRRTVQLDNPFQPGRRAPSLGAKAPSPERRAMAGDDWRFRAPTYMVTSGSARQRWAPTDIWRARPSALVR